MGDQGLERSRVRAEYDGELRLLQLSRLGIHLNELGFRFHGPSLLFVCVSE